MPFLVLANKKIFHFGAHIVEWLDMRIAKSSETIALISLIIALLSATGIFIDLLFYPRLWLSAILLAIIIWCLFVIWTFRDPDREIIIHPNQLLAPADGVVTDIQSKEDGFSLVIRMSPFNVHMNRSPISGVVKEVFFEKGSHWPVYFTKYAKRNQRNTIIIVNEEKGVTAKVVQVSGIYARRAIAYVEPGDEVKQGEVIGTIRFGSITYLEISGAKTYKVLVKPNTSVKAGLSVIAKESE